MGGIWLRESGYSYRAENGEVSSCTVRAENGEVSSCTVRAENSEVSSCNFCDTKSRNEPRQHGCLDLAQGPGES